MQSEIKPKKVAVQDKMVAVNTLALLKEVRLEFDELSKTAAKIAEDCKYDNMLLLLLFIISNIAKGTLTCKFQPSQDWILWKRTYMGKY